jgi:cell division protein FtsQ
MIEIQSAQMNLQALFQRLVLLLILMIIALVVWQISQPWVNQPIQQVTVQGDLSEAQQIQLQSQLRPYYQQRFFELDLWAIRSLIEQNSWVHRALVKRIWPDLLLVEAEREIAVARWNQAGFLNHQGQIIDWSLQNLKAIEDLPRLVGLPQYAKRMQRLYRQLSLLLSRQGLQIVQLELLQRGTLVLQLNNGIRVLLGRHNVLERMARMIAVYHSELVQKASLIQQIDARYPHGVAVTWQQ